MVAVWGIIHIEVPDLDTTPMFHLDIGQSTRLLSPCVPL